MNLPEEADLETARNVIEWLLEDTKQNEPYATNYINALEEVLTGMPSEGDILGT